MSSNVIIDRRKNDGNKSLPNRSRYLNRVREQLRTAVKKVIADGSIADNLSTKAKKVKIKNGGLNQPEFAYRRGSGVIDHVVSYNTKYRVGDRIPKPVSEEQQPGSGGTQSGGGANQDAFEFTISREEFMDIFFEDLELPNLTKKTITDTPEYVRQRAGFSVDGPPSRLNLMRTIKTAKGRRLALRNPKKRRIKELEALIENLLKDAPFNEDEITKVRAEIEVLKKKLKAVPYIDDVDLRYDFYDRKPNPATKAVVFGILDVSGSMNQHMKEMAKRFFILALMFLQRKYEKVEIVWIRHTDTAAEVTEHDFFHSKETGGTVVSTAFELMHEIQERRFPTTEWNIYGVQMSDGDNMHLDNDLTEQLLREKILPVCQYFAYVEVYVQGVVGILSALMNAYNQADHEHSSLYERYQKIALDFPQFAIGRIKGALDIYPLFRKMFKKKWV